MGILKTVPTNKSVTEIQTLSSEIQLALKCYLHKQSNSLQNISRLLRVKVNVVESKGK